MDTERGVCWLVDLATSVVPGRAPALLEAVCQVLGARSGRLFVADYSLRRLQQVGMLRPGPDGLVRTDTALTFTDGGSECGPAHAHLAALRRMV